MIEPEILTHDNLDKLVSIFDYKPGSKRALNSKPILTKDKKLGFPVQNIDVGKP